MNRAAVMRVSGGGQATEDEAMARSTRTWSAEVTRRSDALDLERDVFKQRSATAIDELRALFHRRPAAHH